MDQSRILCFKKNLHIGDQVGSGGGAAHHFLQVLQKGLPPLQLSFVDITPAENAAVGKAGGHTYWITVVAAVGIVVHTFFYSCPVFQTLNALFQCVLVHRPSETSCPPQSVSLQHPPFTVRFAQKYLKIPLGYQAL